jgi:hypothetical protein
MKHAIRALAVAIALIGTATATQASMIVGSQGLAVLTNISSNTGDVSTATVFSNLTFTTTLANSGDYSGFPMDTFGAVSLDLGNLAAFTFGNSEFGTFTPGSLVDGGYNDATKTRSFLIVGEFSPGTAFPAHTTNTAVVSISFTQVGGKNQPISLSGTLITPAPVPAPEPSTIVMLGTICGPLAFFAYRRRQARQSA